LDLYELLQVSRNASKDIIEKAYKTLASKYHPDVVDQQYREQAEEYMKQLNYAREVLTNDEWRNQYNDQLTEEQVARESYTEQAATEQAPQVKEESIQEGILRLPNWLRWILAFPLAWLANLAVRFVYMFSLSRYININYEPLNLLLDAIVGTGTIILTFAYIVPKYKFVASLILSIAISIIYIVIGALLLYTGMYINDSWLFTLVLYFSAVIVAILCMVLIYENNKAD
jgi:hypothetical protein